MSIKQPVSLKKATVADAHIIQQLAHQTWFDTYSSFLPLWQIQAMLEQRYTPHALHKQIAENIETYYLIYEDETAHPIGFLSISKLVNHTAKLHKLYVFPQMQGKGLGSKILAILIELLTNQRLHQLILNVNKNNTQAIQFYIKQGFRIIQSETINIGNGYLMWDYVMKKEW